METRTLENNKKAVREFTRIFNNEHAVNGNDYISLRRTSGIISRCPAATTLVAERHQIKNGTISRVESAFDGRPFAAMFAGKKRT